MAYDMNAVRLLISNQSLFIMNYEFLMKKNDGVPSLLSSPLLSSPLLSSSLLSSPLPFCIISYLDPTKILPSKK